MRRRRSSAKSARTRAWMTPETTSGSSFIAIVKCTGCAKAGSCNSTALSSLLPTSTESVSVRAWSVTCHPTSCSLFHPATIVFVFTSARYMWCRATTKRTLEPLESGFPGSGGASPPPSTIVAAKVFIACRINRTTRAARSRARRAFTFRPAASCTSDVTRFDAIRNAKRCGASPPSPATTSAMRSHLWFESCAQSGGVVGVVRDRGARGRARMITKEQRR
jgi:hypothetical protein